MREFEYKVSVIVPVYNVEKWLDGCIDSLLNQTIDKNDMEILLIDDGSTDNSPMICDQFVARYPKTIKVWHKENEGVSVARNLGIKNAKGKYLMYCDSDDKLSSNVLQECVIFFNKHYDEIDMVTFRDQSYLNEKKLTLHYRYNFLNKTGIYDLEEYPYITQTRLNVCVKNLFENNHLFDVYFKDMHEDQEYILRILSEKMKIGYISQGEYLYNKGNDSSIMTTKFNTINLFEIVTSWFEKLFEKYEKNVPRYVQGLFVNDINWKLTANILFPYHYTETEFQKAMGRIKTLLNRIDIDTIMTHPIMDNFHKHFWISMKDNSDTVIIAKENEIKLLCDGIERYKRSNMEIIVRRCEIKNGVLDFVAFLKSPIFNYIEDDAIIYAIENDTIRVKMDTNIASESAYRSRTYTNRFFEFRHRSKVEVLQSLKFVVEFDGIDYPTSYWFAPSVAFDSKLNRYSFCNGDIEIKYDKGVFYFIPIEREAHKERIWLYSDIAHVEIDNAYYQFQHDFTQKDNITKYYITSIQYSEWNTLFSKEQLPYIIVRNSVQHKELYLAAEKILTAYVNNNDFLAASPFSAAEENKYRSLIQHEIIYLQHGILHASYRQQYSLEVNIAHKIVISSHFERDNFIGKYHYSPEDLIPSGMPRYDYIDRNVIPKKKILFAPSWRGIFAARNSEGEWKINEGKFKTSNYYQKISEFLNSKKLEQLLKQYDFTLDFKPHPIVTGVTGIFELSTEGINIVRDIKIEEYAVYLTDFSSFTFDFVFLKRAIYYFVPDYDEFRSGINPYRELDLEFDKAFGSLTLTPDDALNELEKILSNNCIPENIYQKRMEEFFLPGNNHCKQLYQYLTKD